MVAQTKWIERQFHFDFPVGVMPCVIERLRGTPARLEEMTRSLSGRILTTKIDEGWSVQEHAGHLSDLEMLWHHRLADYRSGAAVLTPADMTNRRTSEANHNAAPLEQILGQFRKLRNELVAQLEQWNDEDAGRSSLHPRLHVPMRGVDWCFFMAEHDDHHLARMMGLARRLREGA